MNAEEFAQEFINDLPDTLKHIDINIGRLGFSKEVFENDPDLKILKKELNKINYDLILDEDPKNYGWKLIKID